jgi:2-oxoglutarate dehydrogenase E1 component
MWAYQVHQEPAIELRVLELLVRTKFVVTISLDPLGIPDADLADVKPPELELSRYGFTGRDLDKEITLGFGILPHFTTEENKIMKLREIIKACKRIYWESDLCVRKKNQLSLIISFIGRAVAIQCIHIPDKEQGDWIRERLEVAKPWSYTVDEKRMILDRLIWSEEIHYQQIPQREAFQSRGLRSSHPRYEGPHRPFHRKLREAHHNGHATLQF